MISWLWLAAAIVLEVCGTTSMKLSEGLTKPLPSLLLFVFYFFSLSALAIALKNMNLSLAYGAWAGLGTILISIISFVHFQESFSYAKVFFISLIIIGLVGLKASD